ncbi:hypothetical protein [Pseudoduganella sp. GCM10020061]|uniref:hypothetical protein n=1 Tax=Pseudoduganella sp. GCM10020061 TaxID=3317345 RepID=UPI0036430CA0
MESDFRKEMDARLDATQAQVAQKLMEHTRETNAIIDSFRQEAQQFRSELADMKVEMRVQFAKIDARFDSMQATMERAIAEVVKWAVGLFIAAMIAFLTVITFVLNHAS